MNLDIEKAPMAKDYRLIHATTLFLVLISTYLVVKATPYFSTMFFYLTLIGFLVSWEDKDIGHAKFNIIEGGFALCFLLVVVFMFRQAAADWKDSTALNFKILFILQSYLSFRLAFKRNYVIIQIITLLLFLMSAVSATAKDRFYFLAAFIYIAAWFFIFKFSYSTEINNRAFSGRYYLTRKSIFTDLWSILRFFLPICILSFLIARSIHLIHPYRIELIPSSQYVVGGKVAKDSDIGYYTPDASPQDFIRRLIRSIDNMENLSTEEKASCLKVLSRLMGQDLPIRETLEDMLGLIDFLKRPGPGIEPGTDDYITEAMSNLNNYARGALMAAEERLAAKFRDRMKDEPPAGSEAARFKDTFKKLKAARDINDVNVVLSSLPKAQSSADRGGFVSSVLYELGLCRTAQLHLQEKGEFETISTILNDMGGEEISPSPEFFKGAFSLDHYLLEAMNRGKLSATQRDQLERLEQDLFQARDRNAVREASEFLTAYARRHAELGNIQHQDMQMLEHSISDFAALKDGLIFAAGGEIPTRYKKTGGELPIRYKGTRKGTRKGTGKGTGERTVKGAGEGAGEGTGKGAREGTEEGTEKETGKGAREGTGESTGQRAGEGTGKGAGKGTGKGTGRGAGKGPGKGFRAKKVQIPDEETAEEIPIQIPIPYEEAAEEIPIPYEEAAEEIPIRHKRAAHELPPVSIIRHELISVDIYPAKRQVPLGLEASFNAIGTWDDGTQKDISIFVDWAISDTKIVTPLSKGRFGSLSQGSTTVSAYISEDVNSEAVLEVVGPRLISITVMGAERSLSLGQHIQLNATGTYSDSHTEDMTEVVTWSVDNEDMCDINEAGQLYAKRMGTVSISAEYQDIKSSPLPIKNRFYAIDARLFPLFLFYLIGAVILIYAFVIYLINKANLERLRTLSRDNPRGYIIELYHYITRIFSLYGIRYKWVISPQRYIRLVGRVYPREVLRPLTYFTEEFQRARYSSQVMGTDLLQEVSQSYNLVIRALRGSNSLIGNIIAGFRVSANIIPFSL